MKKRLYLAAGLIGLVGFGAVAFAQLAVSVPQDLQLGQSDLVQVIPSGVPQRTNTYAPPGLVGSMDQYSLSGVQTTGFSLTPNAGTTWVIINAGSTLATGTIVTPANPSDGGKFCVSAISQLTSATISAASGQSIVGTAASSLLANGLPVCYRWVNPLLDWIRIS